MKDERKEKSKHFGLPAITAMLLVYRIETCEIKERAGKLKILTRLYINNINMNTLKKQEKRHAVNKKAED
jgi:hypothetical protein